MHASTFFPIFPSLAYYFGSFIVFLFSAGRSCARNLLCGKQPLCGACKTNDASMVNSCAYVRFTLDRNYCMRQYQRPSIGCGRDVFSSLFYSYRKYEDVWMGLDEMRTTRRSAMQCLHNLHHDYLKLIRSTDSAN